MARSVFFSFAYEDVKNFKVNVVRQSWRTKFDDETFVDGSIWETDKTHEPEEIMELIGDGLSGTSVTTILIGESTANRRWVNYEIVRSFDKGNGILGVHINRIRGTCGATPRGKDPLVRLGLEVVDEGARINFYELVNGQWYVYDDLPSIRNKKSNSLYFDEYQQFNKLYRFSELFGTLCWDLDNGYQHFASWIRFAAQQVGR